jgi:ribonuclease HI
MGNDIMRPAYNFEPKYRVDMLTREEWTNGPGPPPVVKGLVCYTDGSRTQGRGGGGQGPEYGQPLGRRLSISLGKYVTVFQAEIYAILAFAYGIQTNARSENYISICSDSQAVMKALQAAKTTSPLLWQCQRALNDISTYHSVGLFWVPGHAGIRGNEIADELAREGSVHQFVGPEPALGVSRQIIKKIIQCWLDKQHLMLWQGLAGTQRQARDLISGPRIATKTRLLSLIGRSPGT